MITWMQRHRKYLVITIWISTIAFIGAGFVGWGQYSYGDKSGAIAKVGDVSISHEELQQAYSRLFNQYSKALQGQFDEEQAKKFGLDKQALRQLINEALLLNLANDYNLDVSDSAVARVIQSDETFHSNGTFDKILYQKILKQNRLNPSDYEAQLRKGLLIQKVMALYPLTASPMEKSTFETAYGIADKLEYKIITDAMITIDTSDTALQAFWEQHKRDYLTPRAYKVAVIEQPPVASNADEAEARSYFNAHKNQFAGPDGKLLEFDSAKTAVIAALDDKATNKAALRTYIAFKKNALEGNVAIKEMTVKEGDHQFSEATMQALRDASTLKPFLKPKREGERYVILQLLETVMPEPMRFSAAKPAVLHAYSTQTRAAQKLAQANAQINTFKGSRSGFVKRTDTSGIDGLNEQETREFFSTVFTSDQASGIATLQSKKTVLYRIVDQTLEATETASDIDGAVAQSKQAMLNNGLIKQLNNRYQTNIFIKGFGE